MRGSAAGAAGGSGRRSGEGARAESGASDGATGGSTVEAAVAMGSGVRGHSQSAAPSPIASATMSSTKVKPAWCILSAKRFMGVMGMRMG